nr:uncharacterized protein LOC127492173 [Oryctolagus cuniculus]
MPSAHNVPGFTALCAVHTPWLACNLNLSAWSCSTVCNVLLSSWVSKGLLASAAWRAVARPLDVQRRSKSPRAARGDSPAWDGTQACHVSTESSELRLQQRAGSEEEQLALELALIRDAGTADGGFTRYATVLASLSHVPRGTASGRPAGRSLLDEPPDVAAAESVLSKATCLGLSSQSQEVTGRPRGAHVGKDTGIGAGAGGFVWLSASVRPRRGCDTLTPVLVLHLPPPLWAALTPTLVLTWEAGRTLFHSSCGDPAPACSPRQCSGPQSSSWERKPLPHTPSASGGSCIICRSRTGQLKPSPQSLFACSPPEGSHPRSRLFTLLQNPPDTNSWPGPQAVWPGRHLLTPLSASAFQALSLEP